MNEKINARLAELQTEHANGQRVLADLDVKRQAAVATMLRIEGAMQGHRRSVL